MPKEEKQNELLLDPEQGRPFASLFFTSYHLNKTCVPGFIVMDFAFMDAGHSISRFACTVSITELERQKEAFMKFAASILEGEAPSPTSHPRMEPGMAVVPADFFGWARHGAEGELAILSISWKEAIDNVRAHAKKDAAPRVPARSVALLRCRVELLKRLLFDLYRDENDSTHRA